MDETAKNEPVDAEFEPLDDTETPPSERPGKTPNNRFSLVLLISAAVIVLVLAPTAYAIFSSLGQSAPPVKQADITALDRRLAALETKTAANDKLRASIDGLNQRLTALENTAPFGDKAALGALERRLDTLENKAPASALTAPAAPDISAILATLDDVKARLAALESRPLPATDGSGNAEQLAHLQEAISHLDSTLANDETRLDDLTARLEKIKHDSGAKPDRAAALLTFLALDGAARAGRSFEDERKALAAFLPASRALEALAPLARAGLATRASLRADFNTMSAAVRTAGGAAKEKPKGMLNKMGAALGAVISVRRVDGGGTDANALLTRAQNALDTGDLTLAVHVLSALDGAQKDAAASWVKAANARLTASALLRQVKTELAATTQGNTP